MYRSIKIWVNERQTKFVKAIVFQTTEEMREAYKKFNPTDRNHDEVMGCHCAYTARVVDKKTGKSRAWGNTGRIFLSFEYLGAGLVAHEFMHAVLWAYKHNGKKKQFPIVIKSMKEEEKILHALTFALKTFYNWYWKNEKHFAFKSLW
jgi:hypothetical protein